MSLPHFLADAIRQRQETLTLWAIESNRLVAARLEVAADSASRNRGLLGRASLATDAALVLAPCYAVHTFGMQFPIDIIYTARNGRIVKLSHDVRPWRVSASFGAFATIEMAAGAIDRTALRHSMHLEVRTTGDSAGQPPSRNSTAAINVGKAAPASSPMG